MGSLGARIGKVFKGKKMAGKMGNKQVMVKSLKVFAIDHKRGLLYIQGSVPGSKEKFLRVRDAFFKPQLKPFYYFPT